MFKNGLKVKLPLILSLVALLGLLLSSCVPGELQDAIRATQADVKAVKGDVDKLSKTVAELDKYTKDPEITMAERDIKEHVVRGRADFIAFQDEFTKMNKAISKNMTSLLGTPAKIDKQTGKVAVPAKPGFAQNIDTKLDRLIGIPGKAAVPEKIDPLTDKVIPAKKAVPAKRGMIDDLNDKLDKLVGKPGKAAVAAKIDKQTGKVIAKAVPAVPPTPGAIDTITADLADIKARLEKIEKSMAPAPAAPAAPAKAATP